MKTVLLINSSGSRYFRRVNSEWQIVGQPEHNDKLWVIANLPEEMLETFNLPLLFGRDRSNFLERRLSTVFPHSHYRASSMVSGGLLRSGTAVLTGLSTADAVSSQLEKLDITIAGVWGLSMLLTLMLKRLAIANVLLAIPSAHHLRILVIKDGIPVLTRCVRRYSEDSDNENDSDANEIMRTRQHLENNRIFEHDSIPAILYLSENQSTGEFLTRADLTMMPLPGALAPKGEAGYLHPVLEYVVSSPHGQLAPLQLRARHLAENIRMACYIGIAASMLGILIFGQSDFRALLSLHQRESVLHNEMQLATTEHDRLSDSISVSGKDPALVRQATRFAAFELDRAPVPKSILELAASSISELPQARIKNLTFRLPKQGESYCGGRSTIDLPLLNNMFMMNNSEPTGAGGAEANALPQRHAELQFSIMLTDNLAPAAQAEISRRISTALKKIDGLQLIDDPAAFSLVNTLKGGVGMDTTQTDNIWCMSIPWKNDLTDTAAKGIASHVTATNGTATPAQADQGASPRVPGVRRTP